MKNIEEVIARKRETKEKSQESLDSSKKEFIEGVYVTESTMEVSFSTLRETAFKVTKLLKAKSLNEANKVGGAASEDKHRQSILCAMAKGGGRVFARRGLFGTALTMSYSVKRALIYSTHRNRINHLRSARLENEGEDICSLEKKIDFVSLFAGDYIGLYFQHEMESPVITEKNERHFSGHRDPITHNMFGRIHGSRNGYERGRMEGSFVSSPTLTPIDSPDLVMKDKRVAFQKVKSSENPHSLRSTEGRNRNHAFDKKGHSPDDKVKFGLWEEIC